MPGFVCTSVEIFDGNGPFGALVPGIFIHTVGTLVESFCEYIAACLEGNVLKFFINLATRKTNLLLFIVSNSFHVSKVIVHTARIPRFLISFSAIAIMSCATVLMKFEEVSHETREIIETFFQPLDVRNNFLSRIVSRRVSS